MNIQAKALGRIRQATIDGPKLAEIFEKMSLESELVGGTSAVTTIDYQEPGDDVDSDTLIPQIVLILRHSE